jgi:xanthine dehydrogenase YagR molybdenum-binding subunit
MTMVTPRPRVDARAKVTGAARYGADHRAEGVVHAAFAVATVGRGRIVEIDTAAAEAVSGVLLVLTRVDASELQAPGFIMTGGHCFQGFQPLLDDWIAYRGQPIALVVAQTSVAATEAANLVRARYEVEPVAVHLDDQGAEVLRQQDVLPLPDINVGSAEAEYARSEVRIDETFEHPSQNATAMELLASVVEWRGETLVIHEGTQNAGAVRNGVALQLGIDPANVEVISPYAGGGFGQKNSMQPHVGLLAVAARRLGRPVSFVMTRPQTFHQGSFRPATRQRVRLGADRSGRLSAAIHEVDQQTSRHDLFPAMYVEMTSRLYGVPNFLGSQRLVRTDVQTPGYMRAPFESPAAFAFEVAIDELAYATGQDPVALRLTNDTDTDPVTGLPFSSRHLAECLRRGAERFGWSARDPRPGSMRADDGTQIGWGVAIGAYPASITPAVAHVRADAHGRIAVEVDGHEMGQGIRSAITLLVADELGVAVDDVALVVGDTRVAPQHLTAGSWGTASALPAVYAALRALRGRLGVADAGPVDVASAVAASGQPSVAVQAATFAPGQTPEILDVARSGRVAFAGPVYPEFVAFSFIAHFVEVHVEPTTRRVRVPRVLSVADCGRVASPVTAASQMRGGVVWGLGGALREVLEVDRRYGGFINQTLEDYPISVSADIGDIEVDFIDQPDLQFNPVGVKGLGELSMVGVVPALVNAVYHATNRRFRRLPITVAALL